MIITVYLDGSLQEAEQQQAKFCKHYSDNNLMIKKLGTDEVYSEAVDLMPCAYDYEETDILIEVEDGDTNNRVI